MLSESAQSGMIGGDSRAAITMARRRPIRSDQTPN
jgi:hypothetical protein